MDHIETAILNCYGIREAEQNMVLLPGSHNTVIRFRAWQI